MHGMTFRRLGDVPKQRRFKIKKVGESSSRNPAVSHQVEVGNLSLYLQDFTHPWLFGSIILQFMGRLSRLQLILYVSNCPLFLKRHSSKFAQEKTRHDCRDCGSKKPPNKNLQKWHPGTHESMQFPMEKNIHDFPTDRHLRKLEVPPRYLFSISSPYQNLWIVGWHFRCWPETWPTAVPRSTMPNRGNLQSSHASMKLRGGWSIPLKKNLAAHVDRVTWGTTLQNGKWLGKPIQPCLCAREENLQVKLDHFSLPPGLEENKKNLSNEHLL